MSGPQVVNDLAEMQIFESVSAYVITDDNNIVVQKFPRSNQWKHEWVKSFGGLDKPRNLFFMINQLRLELLDESSLGLQSGVTY